MDDFQLHQFTLKSDTSNNTKPQRNKNQKCFAFTKKNLNLLWNTTFHSNVSIRGEDLVIDAIILTRGKWIQEDILIPSTSSNNFDVNFTNAPY